ncbi:ATP-dependent DNA helicase Q1 [Herpailurus yagouaroundi]|uniref:ATP-dependent DNA helicase Q1 n=1 Tax=Herpailurus yagouaroundi TaxID=1608482 RepID=UPI001AD66A18|nr:ATP-dependent DNA helicase Q1 [Puma yagouaroundi]
MAAISALTEELESVTNELHAVDIQIQELLEKQQELIQKKNILTNQIKQHFEDSDAGESSEWDSSPAAWNKEDFPWSGKVKEVLQNVFKLQRFRLLQLETINVTMSGKEVFLVMPTGGGKSLCYQLPALCSDGFTLVICPLISLMEDQLMVLKQLGISATMLNASSPKEHVKWVHAEMVNKNSKLKLIYVTPEKIAKSKMFMSRLEKAYEARRFTRIAVDEVHCCSHWGHDFRPDYKALGILKRQFPNTALIGLTATATSHVLKDAQKILCVEKCFTFTASFNRPNLYYEVCNFYISFACLIIACEVKNVTAYCRDLIKILKQAEDLNEKLTPLKLMDSWMGKGAAKLRVAGVAPPQLPREDLEKIIAHFLLQQYLKEDYSFTAYATISYLKIGPKAHLLNNEAHVITMQVKKPTQSCFKTESSETCHSEGADKRREEKNSGNFQKSANMLQRSKNTGTKKRKIDDADECF